MVFSLHISLLLILVLHSDPDLAIDIYVSKVEVVLEASSKIRTILIVLSKTHYRCYDNPP